MILKKDMTAQQDDYKICFNRKYSVVFIFFFYVSVAKARVWDIFYQAVK